jgi:hypothetical protein
MLKITELVDSKLFVDLPDSETVNICGGECLYDWRLFTAGSVIKQSDGFDYKCVDKPWYDGGDVWERA